MKLLPCDITIGGVTYRVWLDDDKIAAWGYPYDSRTQEAIRRAFAELAADDVGGVEKWGSKTTTFEVENARKQSQ